MCANVLSQCHSLELIPVESIDVFARLGGSARLTLRPGCGSTDSGAIPGTIKVGHSTKNGLMAKSINYEIPGPDVATERMLRTLSLQRLVAVYVDERGNEKICGSPTYPLRLTYTPDEGFYSVTLTGTDSEADAFRGL